MIDIINQILIIQFLFLNIALLFIQIQFMITHISAIAEALKLQPFFQFNVIPMTGHLALRPVSQGTDSPIYHTRGATGNWTPIANGYFR